MSSSTTRKKATEKSPMRESRVLSSIALRLELASGPGFGDRAAMVEVLQPNSQANASSEWLG